MSTHPESHQSHVTFSSKDVEDLVYYRVRERAIDDAKRAFETELRNAQRGYRRLTWLLTVAVSATGFTLAAGAVKAMHWYDQVRAKADSAQVGLDSVRKKTDDAIDRQQHEFELASATLARLTGQAQSSVQDLKALRDQQSPFLNQIATMYTDHARVITASAAEAAQKASESAALLQGYQASLEKSQTAVADVVKNTKETVARVTTEIDSVKHSLRYRWESVLPESNTTPRWRSVGQSPIEIWIQNVQANPRQVTLYARRQSAPDRCFKRTLYPEQIGDRPSDTFIIGQDRYTVTVLWTVKQARSDGNLFTRTFRRGSSKFPDLSAIRLEMDSLPGLAVAQQGEAMTDENSGQKCPVARSE